MARMVTIEKTPEEQLLDTFRVALGHEPTRKLLRWVLDQTGMFGTAYTGDSAATFYREGRRDVGLEIVAMVNQIDPYEFVRLMKEGVDDLVIARNAERDAQDVD